MSDDSSDVFGPPGPKWPRVIGTISLVLGIIAVSCGVLGVGAAAGTNALVGAMMGGQLPDGVPPPPNAPPLDALMLAAAVFGLGVNALLIVAGLSLRRRRSSARNLHLVYALVAVLAAFLGTYNAYSGTQKQQAAMERWLDDHGETDLGKMIKRQQEQQAALQQTIQTAALAGGAGLSLAWPVFCIVWFGMIKRDGSDITGAE